MKNMVLYLNIEQTEEETKLYKTNSLKGHFEKMILLFHIVLKRKN